MRWYGRDGRVISSEVTESSPLPKEGLGEASQRRVFTLGLEGRVGGTQHMKLPDAFRKLIRPQVWAKDGRDWRGNRS